MTPQRSATPVLELFPSTPLPEQHHHQVRAVLVREAAPTSRRTTVVRWAVPMVGIAAAAAAVVALGGSPLLGGEKVAVEPSSAVDCSLGAVRGEVTDVPDAWRLLSGAPGALVVDQAWVNLQPTTCGDLPTDRPLQALAALADDGTVTAALTVWTDSPPPAAGPDVEAATVRGTEGTVQLGTTQYGTERVWWSEDGRALSVSVAGLDRPTMLALVERLGADGILPSAHVPDGMTALEWEVPADLESYEPIWYASYWVPGTSCDGGDPECTADLPAIEMDVQRTSQPWQAGLSRGLGGPTPPRVVDVVGNPGLLFDNGTGDLWLVYSLGDGVQVQVQGRTGDGSTDSTLGFARTLVPVSADDPRIVAPAP